ncbi:MAG: holdfast anchoring protein HfaB [Alphaproteobacteria bacterium]|nr:holdfast anchoring protein HfaB [Alphaproteobacteria bacterium]
MRVVAGVAALALALTGCVPLPVQSNGNYADPIGGAPVTENPTPYSAALYCLADFAAQRHIAPPHIAVGPLRDQTGQIDNNGGRPLPQGAMLMAISALGRAGVPLVERYETDVPKLEFDLSDNRLISDAPNRGQPRDYRPIKPGQITGSAYFLAGGITELNTSIRNVSADIALGRGHTVDTSTDPHLGGSAYVMNIGLDIRLIDTNSLDIVDIVSYQKQIVGYQVGAGLFAFFNGQVLSVGANDSASEPVQLAVRSLIERAIVEIVSHLYRIPSATCLNPASDPLQGAPRPGWSAVPPKPAPAVQTAAPPVPPPPTQMVQSGPLPTPPKPGQTPPPPQCCSLRPEVHD